MTSRAARPHLVLALAALLVTLPAAAAAAPARAAVTIGSDLSAPVGDPFSCGSGCTIATTSLPGLTVASPIDGVLVRWRARVSIPSRPLSDTIELRTLRPAGGGSYTARGSDRGTPTANGAVSTFAARLRVSRGDLIGLDLGSGEGIGAAPSGSGIATFSPALGASETRAPASLAASGSQLLYNADIEPDADGDGHGDESQDQCPQLAEKKTSRCVADLRLSHGGAAPAEAVLGELIRYYVKVTNGGHRSLGITLDAAIARRLTLISASVDPGSCGRRSAGRLSCSLGELPANKSRTVRFVLRVDGVGRGAPAVSRFSVAGQVPERDLANNTMETSVSIVPPGPCMVRRAGGDDDDRILGGLLGNMLVGGRGDDGLFGRAGADCVSGGPGNDRLDGGSGVDRLGGGPGYDRLKGGRGNDRLDGGTHDDRLIGGRGRDRFMGGDGDDRINARDRRRERIDCGPGRDRAKVDRKDRVVRCERVLRPKRPRRGAHWQRVAKSWKFGQWQGVGQAWIARPKR